MHPQIRLRRWASRQGFTLMEALVAISVLMLVMGLGLHWSREAWARLQVEMAARRLAVGLERGRDAAERSGAPCALVLDAAQGWVGMATKAAVACMGADTPLYEGLWPAELQVAHTFTAPVEFTVNGLAIDGGTVVVGHAGTELVRCVVMSPPLGVTRVGSYEGTAMELPNSQKCKPDPLL